ncbi:MAG: ATP-binding cassette domain-containing protein [Candidatus Krumholzibacteriia bacterium]
MIVADKLTKVYPGKRAIHEVTFEVEKGEIVGFLGPNGAGKTTTMRILTCFQPATKGTARVAGYDVFEQADDVKRNIGYLPESPPLYLEMRVREYLEFVARIKGVPRSRTRVRLADTVERCGLGDVQHRITGKLSKGYRQRVGLAQAILHDPAILILDEPTSGLDPKQVVEVRRLIGDLAGEHTIILSTHILAEVSMTCQRVIIINEGRIVLSRRLRDLAGHGPERETLLLHLQADRDVAEDLSGIDGVHDLKALPANGHLRYRLVCSRGPEVRHRLSSFVVRQGWWLLELRAEETDLEAVYLRAVSSEGGLG